MIQFTMMDEERELVLLCDQQGADRLIRLLEKLKQHGGHEHLMTMAWGGGELTEGPTEEGARLIHQVRIVCQMVS